MFRPHGVSTYYILSPPLCSISSPESLRSNEYRASVVHYVMAALENHWCPTFVYAYLMYALHICVFVLLISFDQDAYKEIEREK